MWSKYWHECDDEECESEEHPSARLTWLDFVIIGVGTLRAYADVTAQSLGALHQGLMGHYNDDIDSRRAWADVGSTVEQITQEAGHGEWPRREQDSR